MADKHLPELKIEHLEQRFSALNHVSDTHQRYNNSLSEEEDRLSSLPDAILIDILSCLEIHEAAATSVLSRRWCHLWTGVSRFKLHSSCFDCESCPSVIVDILQQLTSPKICVFGVHMRFLVCCATDIVESCFRELCCRNVEEIVISAKFIEYKDHAAFCLPACLFEIQSLVTLKLEYPLKLPDNAVIQCTNLKTVQLCALVNFPSWLGKLFSSCPLLEHLTLWIRLILGRHKPHPDVQIFASNLKSLTIMLRSPSQTPPAKIFIDAPTLTNLNICDITSHYYFVQKPLGLIRADIISRKDMYNYDELGSMAVNNQEGYMHQMLMFLSGMSSVHHLALAVVQLNQKNLYTYLKSLVHGPQTIIFPNLVFLNTALGSISVNGWNDLLLSLHCFPNLNRLDVRMLGFLSEEDSWVVPDSVPNCLVSKLKEIHLWLAMKMTTDEFMIANELKLLAYILSNATVLEKLCISFTINGNIRAEAKLWNASKFCQSLFKLPRGSSTCEIKFSNSYMEASSKDFKDGIVASVGCRLFS